MIRWLRSLLSVLAPHAGDDKDDVSHIFKDQEAALRGSERLALADLVSEETITPRTAKLLALGSIGSVALLLVAINVGQARGVAAERIVVAQVLLAFSSLSTAAMVWLELEARAYRERVRAVAVWLYRRLEPRDDLPRPLLAEVEEIVQRFKVPPFDQGIWGRYYGDDGPEYYGMT